jgi:hypothetical protein
MPIIEVLRCLDLLNSLESGTASRTNPLKVSYGTSGNAVDAQK